MLFMENSGKKYDLQYQILRSCAHFIFNLNKQMHKKFDSRSRKVRKKTTLNLTWHFIAWHFHLTWHFIHDIVKAQNLHPLLKRKLFSEWNTSRLITQTNHHKNYLRNFVWYYDTFFVRKPIAWLSTFNKIHVRLFILCRR